MKKTLLISAFVLLLCILCSCSTTVAVKNLVPSELSMGAYKNLAVASTSPYKFNLLDYFANSKLEIRGPVVTPPNVVVPDFVSNFSNSISNYTANLATQEISTALNQGFFNLSTPTETDALVNYGKIYSTVRSALVEKDIDAILTTSIKALNITEYITIEIVKKSVKQSDGTYKDFNYYNYYLNQEVGATLSYTVSDVKGNAIIVTDVLTGKNTRKTYLGQIDHTNKFIKTGFYDASLNSVFDPIISDFSQEIMKKLTPYYTTSYETLMANKPKDENIKEAYKLARQGSYRLSLQLFETNWENFRHVPSGYNAAILYQALGDYDNAIKQAGDVYSVSGNAKALTLQYTIQQALDNSNTAKAQMDSSASPLTAEAELTVFQTL